MSDREPPRTDAPRTGAVSADALLAEGLRTDVGRANAERVTLRGHDLVGELVGRMSFTEAALLAVTGERPAPGAVRVADAVLVTFIDHGLQPSALAARLTYHVAPEAVQGAVAAGLLGVGSRILGTLEQTGRLLTRIADETAADGEGDGEGEKGAAGRSGARAGTGAVAGEDEAVVRAVADELAAGRRIPGIGHALHRDGDPRAAPLLAVAAGEGVAEDEIRRLRAIADVTAERTGRTLPPNAAGVSAALLLGIGVPWPLHRGFSMISRTAGLVAHIGEEAERPLTPAVRAALREASRPDED
ncbi:citrate synthase [Streptomyces sp. Amel2xB2]|uniref:citryl-CoA lyase n=1 Tax=Streptomyces sp. Amel2xB2 TaxID=1305829 RepID=UPI000DB9E3D8|nr:citryl-CoA lyase [Streptomyces sp. Amel2xB2]RAJ59073.1 citrate synthase [Streptomyces sp. Amel2xB2]